MSALDDAASLDGTCSVAMSKRGAIGKTRGMIELGNWPRIKCSCSANRARLRLRLLRWSFGYRVDYRACRNGGSHIGVFVHGGGFFCKFDLFAARRFGDQMATMGSSRLLFE